MDLDTLISQTSALSWDEPVNHLSQNADATTEGPFALVGKIIAQRPIIPLQVEASLIKAWHFAVPFSFQTTNNPYKFIFTFTQRHHKTRIMKQPTWNVKSSLLVLKEWSLDQTLNEIEFSTSSFWVQIHDLTLRNMTRTSAVAIGLGLGKLLEVENFEDSGMLCRSYLRIQVEFDVSKPLKPGFLLERAVGSSTWCSLKYERLGDYCVSCGLIGHKEAACRVPRNSDFAKDYKVSLIASNFSSFRSSAAPSRGIGAMEQPKLYSNPERNSAHVSEPESTQSQVICSNPNPHIHLPHACTSLVNHTHVTSISQKTPSPINPSSDPTATSVGEPCPLFLPSLPSPLLKEPNKIPSPLIGNFNTINAQISLNQPFIQFTPTADSLPNLNFFHIHSDPSSSKNSIISLGPNISINSQQPNPSLAPSPSFGPTLNWFDNPIVSAEIVSHNSTSKVDIIGAHSPVSGLNPISPKKKNPLNLFPLKQSKPLNIKKIPRKAPYPVRPPKTVPLKKSPPPPVCLPTASNYDDGSSSPRSKKRARGNDEFSQSRKGFSCPSIKPIFPIPSEEAVLIPTLKDESKNHTTRQIFKAARRKKEVQEVAVASVEVCGDLGNSKAEEAGLAMPPNDQ